MSEVEAKASAHLTIYRMLVLSAIGLAVGTISSFATIGFVELVIALNDLLFVSTESRSQLSTGMLAIVTISALTIGGLIVGIILNLGIKSQYPLGPSRYDLCRAITRKVAETDSGSTLYFSLSIVAGLWRFGWSVWPRGLPRRDHRSAYPSATAWRTRCSQYCHRLRCRCGDFHRV